MLLSHCTYVQRNHTLQSPRTQQQYVLMLITMLELGISVFVVRMLELGCGDMPHLIPTSKVKLASIVSYIL